VHSVTNAPGTWYIAIVWCVISMHYKYLVLPISGCLSHVSHVLDHKSLPDRAYQVPGTPGIPTFDSLENLFCKIHSVSPEFISKLKPRVPTIPYSLSPDFLFYHDARQVFLYYNKKNCDGDSKYGLGLMQGSIPNSDSFCLKLCQFSFQRILTLSICYWSIFNTIFSKENP